ncbi:MAG: non-homologous end-joining DNA ligase, partial [Planctomycetota bacterium]|nr:non-homologous end-joining DNA ligase [Planctomycetota bacterium]
VLKSWAVPRGFSYVPGDKRLAVRTEDHPLEYVEFQGRIPEGQYGAGHMSIWDKGPYEVLGSDDPLKTLARGKLELRFHGKRLRGEWHMVKTKRGKDEWLLFKAKDLYAREQVDLPYPFAIDLRQAKRRGFPRKLAPMLPARQVKPFTDPGWLFEVQLEGVRVFVLKRGDRVRIREASSGEELQGELGDVKEAVGKIRAENAVLDAVLVALDEGHRPCRQTVERVLGGDSDAELSCCVFDLLYYDEWYLGSVPLLDRKKLLETLLPRRRSLSLLNHVLGEGESLLEVVSEAGLPGLIAKEGTGPYEGGRSLSWRGVAASRRARSTRKGVLDILGASRRRRDRFGRVRFTNRHKLYFPEAGYTKGDVLDYYERVGEFLVPYLHERPLHMHRFPDGIDGKSFYHHNAPGDLPRWISTESIRGSDRETIRYIVCNDRETLLYAVNLGSIDLHPWLSRRGQLDTPDWLIVDLDPDRSPFPLVVKAARAVGKVLRGLGLRPYLKTSGASGLHISVPLLPNYTYEQARMFAEGVARYVAQEHPDFCTVERSVPRRRGRVYLDFLQNRRGQTVVPPYVLRPVPAASVSTPLDWDELTGDLLPGKFTLATVPARLARVGDLYRGTLTDRQDLLEAIEAFRELLRT